MISKTIKEKLWGILEDMIPEYKKSEELKEEIKKDYLDFINSYLKEKDKYLMETYPDYIVTSNNVSIIGEWANKFEDINIKCPDDYSYYSYRNKFRKFYTIEYDKPIPRLVDRMEDLKRISPSYYKKLRLKIVELVKTRNQYIIMYQEIHKMLGHKNFTLGLLKEKFPELYTKYLSVR